MVDFKPYNQHLNLLFKHWFPDTTGISLHSPKQPAKLENPSTTSVGYERNGRCRVRRVQDNGKA